jgi:hypothetical protein
MIDGVRFVVERIGFESCKQSITCFLVTSAVKRLRGMVLPEIWWYRLVAEGFPGPQNA